MRVLSSDDGEPNIRFNRATPLLVMWHDCVQPLGVPPHRVSPNLLLQASTETDRCRPQGSTEAGRCRLQDEPRT